MYQLPPCTVFSPLIAGHIVQPRNAAAPACAHSKRQYCCARHALQRSGQGSARMPASRISHIGAQRPALSKLTPAGTQVRLPAAANRADGYAQESRRGAVAAAPASPRPNRAGAAVPVRVGRPECRGSAYDTYSSSHRAARLAPGSPITAHKRSNHGAGPTTRLRGLERADTAEDLQ